MWKLFAYREAKKVKLHRKHLFFVKKWHGILH